MNISNQMYLCQRRAKLRKLLNELNSKIGVKIFDVFESFDVTIYRLEVESFGRNFPL